MTTADVRQKAKTQALRRASEVVTLAQRYADQLGLEANAAYDRACQVLEIQDWLLRQFRAGRFMPLAQELAELVLDARVQPQTHAGRGAVRVLDRPAGGAILAQGAVRIPLEPHQVDQIQDALRRRRRRDRKQAHQRDHELELRFIGEGGQIL